MNDRDNGDKKSKWQIQIIEKERKEAQTALASIPAVMHQLDDDGKHMLADILQAVFDSGVNFEQR